MFVLNDFFNDFKIMNLCGIGASSQVYKIENITTSKLYALKEIIDSSCTNEAIGLMHPNIRYYIKLEMHARPEIITKYLEDTCDGALQSDLFPDNSQYEKVDCLQKKNRVEQSLVINEENELEKEIFSVIDSKCDVINEPSSSRSSQSTVTPKISDEESNGNRGLAHSNPDFLRFNPIETKRYYKASNSWQETKIASKRNSIKVFDVFLSDQCKSKFTLADWKRIAYKNLIMRQKRNSAKNLLDCNFVLKEKPNNCKNTYKVSMKQSKKRNSIKLLEHKLETPKFSKCRLSLQSITTVNCCRLYYYAIAKKYKSILEHESTHKRHKNYKNAIYIRTIAQKLDLLRKINIACIKNKICEQKYTERHKKNAINNQDALSIEYHQRAAKKEKKTHLTYFLSCYCDYTLRDLINYWCCESKLASSLESSLYDRLSGVSIDFKRIFYKIVLGLQFLHKNNLIHRDIKPENIFFDKATNLNPKIGDFGLVKEIKIDDNYSQMTNDVGTEIYAAPELKTSNYDNRVDVYSLGIILYEITAPFKTQMERIESITDLKLSKNIVHMQENRFEEIIIQKCIQNDPKKRPSTDALLIYLSSWAGMTMENC